MLLPNSYAGLTVKRIKSVIMVSAPYLDYSYLIIIVVYTVGDFLYYPRSMKLPDSLSACILPDLENLLSFVAHMILQYSCTVTTSMMLHRPLPNAIPILTMMPYTPAMSNPHHSIPSAIPCGLNSCIGHTHQCLSQEVEAVHSCRRS